ncbi:response regulator transcription factor [Chromobacterium haemolyticum]|uniref:Response regulator transcription factor n=1 Tax=Chromobacterium fluminis TaxID=3044269 RepID=A0ABX0L837_9NEIS|nr:response regulator transcription factor [Chromobacterium haemolyticum]NHR03587.1 response regulator transcription factor [Chromobacterium haemolyticum]
MKKRKIKVMLLDDHEVVRQGLGFRLSQESDIVLAGCFGDSRSFLAALNHDRPDVLVLDYALQPQDMDGLNLIRAIRARFPEVAILIMSSYYNTATVSLALRAGARGFVGKQQDLDELVRAIRVAVTGRVYLTAEMALELAQAQQADSVPADSSTHAPDAMDRVVRLSALSPREMEVLRCFLDGMTVSEIADKFSKSIKTISGQKQAAIKKLGLKSDHELYFIKDEIK